MYAKRKTRTALALAATLPLLVGISTASVAANSNSSAKDQISVTSIGSTKDQISVTSSPGKGKGNTKVTDTTTSTTTKGKGNNKTTDPSTTKGKGSDKPKTGNGKPKVSDVSTMTLLKTLTMPTASTLGYEPGAKNTYTGEVLCSTGKLCPAGRTIWDLEFDAQGNLVAGYGDYDTNVDSFGNKPVSIEAVDPDTGALVGAPVPVGTEAFDTIKKIDGALYIPTTDPSDRNGKSGVWTNKSGSWEFISSGEPMTHVFDVEVMGDNIYMAGSIDHSAVVIGGPIDGAKKRMVSIGGNANRVYSIEAVDASNLVFSGYFNGGSPAVLNVDTGAVRHIGFFADHTDRMFQWGDDVIEWQGNRLLMTMTARGQDVRIKDLPEYVSSPREAVPFVGDDNKMYMIDGAGGATINIWSFDNKYAEPVKVGTISGKSHNDLSGAGAVKDGKIYLGTINGTVKVFQL